MKSWQSVCFIGLFLLAALSCSTSGVKDKGETPAVQEGKGQEIGTSNATPAAATPAPNVPGTPAATTGQTAQSETAGETAQGAAREENPENLKPYSENPLTSNPGDGAAITIDSTTIFAGVVLEGDNADCTFTMHNVGKKDLNILSVQPG